MSELVFLLEEPSARAMLEGILPKLLPENLPIRYLVFEGKQDLERQMVRRLRGYRTPGAQFVVLRDQDASDCHDVKNKLYQHCRDAGKPEVLVRIACHEIESWYLSDLVAVENGLAIAGLSAKQNTRKFRTPDNLSNPAKELMTLTGYRYQKISGSRSIGPYLDLENKRSPSFKAFITGIKQLINKIPSSSS